MINVKLNSKQGDDEFERMRLFCALRHFPELRTSLAVAGQVDIPEPQSKLKSTNVKPKLNDNFKLGFSNRNAHKVLKNLSTSVLAEVPDQYGPVRSGMRQRREDFRNSQMSHKQSYNTLSRPSSANNNHTGHQVRPRSPTNNHGPVEDIEDPLRRVCFKLSQAGISLGHRNILDMEDVSKKELRSEVRSSGLLAVLGLPPVLSSAPTTPRFSPRNTNNHSSGVNNVNNQTAVNTSINRGSSPYLMRENSYNTHEGDEQDYYVGLLKQRLEVILCIRVDPDELSVLYDVLYIAG